MYYFYKFGQFVALRLPLRITYAIASFCATACYILFCRDRRALRANIGVVLGYKQRVIKLDVYARRAFVNFAKYLVDFLRFAIIDSAFIEKFIDVKGRENLDAAFGKGKGAILLSSHVGNWELGAAIISCIGYPLNAIALGHSDSKVNEFFVNQRESKGVKVIPIGSNLRKCFTILKKNEGIAILGDRDFTDSGEEVLFFGKKTVLPKGPAYFSLKSGAPIVPTFMLRNKNDRFSLVFGEPIQLKPTGDRDKDVMELMGTYIKVIEKYIRKYPDQWYVFRKVWNSI